VLLEALALNKPSSNPDGLFMVYSKPFRSSFSSSSPPPPLPPRPVSSHQMAFGERGIGIGAGELMCPWGMALCALN
jgi:hypothetical protein